jgi:hypothetical protein
VHRVAPLSVVTARWAIPGVAAPRNAHGWSVMALGTMGGRLVRQRAAILIVLGLALFGGICGWLLRDQLIKRGHETLQESTTQHDS